MGGGHLGRFCVWTQGAFEKLDTWMGTMTRPSSTRKHNGTPARLPQMQMKNSDLSRIINSDEVQSVLNAPKQGQKPRGLKCNPLKNAKAMERVNPYAAVKKELEAKKQKVAEKAKKDLSALKKAGKNKPAKKDPKVSALKKSFYQSMIAD